MDDTGTFNVLFVDTRNSGRSILAEAILNSVAGGRFRASSCGSAPAGTVNPLAIDILQRNHVVTLNLRSKPREEFARPDSPALDFVFNLCEQAAALPAPAWPGQPITVQWHMPDPQLDAGTEDERRRAFLTAFASLYHRLMIFVSLPMRKLDRIALQHRLSSMTSGDPWDGKDRRQA